MAAGLGFKDFVTGEVLTAADVDGYLMQGIWVFDDAAARDAAVTSPEEGNFAFLKDTNVTTYYTGSAWANLDTTGMKSNDHYWRHYLFFKWFNTCPPWNWWHWRCTYSGWRCAKLGCACWQFINCR
jgi:hypothetical protein